MSLKITINGSELFDEKTDRFITIKPTILYLEHSLIAISKWEAKYHKPFLKEDEKTPEELEYYFQCMTINQNVDPMVYKSLTVAQQQEILEYIRNPMTATWFGDNDKKPGRGKGRRTEVITSELIYYWMVALQIPSEYEKWHLNRLLTLIQVCNAYNQPPKKMSKNETIRNNDALNAARRAAMRTRG
jgi:hypothetical protein